MGATTWHYFVPYEADTEAALQRLRKQVFKDGSYGSGVPSPDQMKAMFEEVLARSPNPALARQQMEDAMASLAQLQQQMPPEPPKPDTIEELLEQRAENGSHSILDIQCVAPAPEFGAVSPMPAERLKQIFGATGPTRNMVESKLGDFDLVEDPLVSERWQGIYFTVYREGKPDEIFFMGTSGD
jgi:hypothetical protein